MGRFHGQVGAESLISTSAGEVFQAFPRRRSPHRLEELGEPVVGLAGAARHARVITGAAGLGLIAYTAYLWVFFDAQSIYEVYPWIFAGPLLVVGYHFYTRASDREADAAARVAFEAERAQRRAARAAEQEHPDA